MFEIFLGIIFGCLGILAITFTLFVLVVIIDTVVKQIKKK